MKIPTNAIVRLTTDQEHARFVEAMEALPGLKVHFMTDNELAGSTEAYLTVAGNKIATGNLREMLERFKLEVQGHSASVAVHAKTGGEWKIIQRRVPQNLSGR